MSQITTHILDTSKGKPAIGVKTSLLQQNGDQWRQIDSASTNNDGRIVDWQHIAPLPAGLYKIIFETGVYYQQLGETSFYPSVEVIFAVEGDGQHYHVPLLLNPYGYSTYRGS